MIKFVDMFSGIGGFREGLSRAGGFICVGHCEIDKHANRSYRALFDTEGEWFVEDARKANPETINHGNGLETLYAHCSSICVATSQQVQAGEVIGYVGHTGRATGNHLHLEVRINGNRSDVMAFFS